MSARQQELDLSYADPEGSGVDIVFRGLAEIPWKRIEENEESLTAKPRRSKRAPGSGKEFPAYYRLSENRGLVPKYRYLRKRANLRDPMDRITFRGLDLSGRFEFQGDLRDEQKPGVQAALDMLSRWRGVVIRGRCGSGKTVVGVYILSRARSERSVILVDQQHVAEQWAEEITRFMPSARISFIMPKQTQNRIRKKIGMAGKAPAAVDTSGDIVIAMAQTCYRHLDPKNPIPCGMVVVDEAHKFSAYSFMMSIFNFCFSYSMALTATDDRPDKLSWIFKDVLGPNVVDVSGRRMEPRVLVVDTPLRERIEESDHQIFFCESMFKTMTRHRCRGFCALDGRCQYQCDSTKIHFNDMWKALVQDEDYHQHLLTLICALYRNGWQALIFSKFKAHLQSLRDSAVQIGIPEDSTSLFFGGMEKEPCLAKQLTFTTYKNTEHAINAPHKDAALFCMPINRVEQVGGRIERYVEGKRQPVILDPFVRGTTTFAHQHKNHVKFYRSRGYGIIQCNPGDAAMWLSQGCQTSPWPAR